MCSNYQAPKNADLPAFSDTRTSVKLQFPPEMWPGYGGPFLANFDASEYLIGSFGLVPFWAEPKLARNTYNARSETVATKPAYRHAWKEKQLCLIPAQAFYEPNYETGSAVRWRIERADGKPMCIAGIWERRMDDPGLSRWSFSMLTVNADDHPLMKRFHKPDDEKRSVVVLDEEDWQPWLQSKSEPDARSLLQLFNPEIMVASPDPLPPRKSKAAV